MAGEIIDVNVSLRNSIRVGQAARALQNERRRLDFARERFEEEKRQSEQLFEARKRQEEIDLITLEQKRRDAIRSRVEERAKRAESRSDAAKRAAEAGEEEYVASFLARSASMRLKARVRKLNEAGTEYIDGSELESSFDLNLPPVYSVDGMRKALETRIERLYGQANAILSAPEFTKAHGEQLQEYERQIAEAQTTLQYVQDNLVNPWHEGGRETNQRQALDISTGLYPALEEGEDPERETALLRGMATLPGERGPASVNIQRFTAGSPSFDTLVSTGENASDFISAVRSLTAGGNRGASRSAAYGRGLQIISSVMQAARPEVREVLGEELLRAARSESRGDVGGLLRSIGWGILGRPDPELMDPSGRPEEAPETKEEASGAATGTAEIESPPEAKADQGQETSASRRADQALKDLTNEE